MPVYTYRYYDTGDEFDEFYVSWRDAPNELVIEGRAARRVPSLPAPPHLANPLVVAKAAVGQVPWEPGMEKDAQRARQYQEEKRDARRKQYLEKIFSGGIV